MEVKHSTLQCRNSVPWQFVFDGESVRLKRVRLTGVDCNLSKIFALSIYLAAVKSEVK